ncbi:MAG TPA: alpha-(1-_6)-mannopyranosyltransferase A [Candidatus Corynebacterium avicola]|uniref:Alpha-(1->6)-mannopyranosyltransferase A n=1 Tax=Candidatus Corynebacterium avicola TaxID=2838527 RepID=A0A9D1RU09_9CORY|nr:alpha-(1->6)-mannopyranosyltransferase A [Candidatus Corynebacterium avicola]
MALCSYSVGATRYRGGLLQEIGWSNVGFGHLYGIVIAFMWVAILLLVASWIIIGGRLVRLGEPVGTWPVVAWVAPFVLAGPVMSRDVYSYLMQGTLARDGLNAYEVGASANPGRLFFEVSADWRNTTTPYGPLHLWLGEGIVRVTGENITLGVLAYKLVSIAGLVALIAAVRALTRAVTSSERTAEIAVWIGVVNPLAVIHFIGGMHSEVLMMPLVVAGLLLAVRMAPWQGLLAGSALIAVAVALKATALIALPFLVWIFVARVAGALPGADGPRRSVRQVLADLRVFTGRRFGTLVAGGLASVAATGVVLALATWISGQTWGWVAEISGNSKVINPLSLPSLIAGVLTRPIGWINEDIYFNQILDVTRAVSSVLMLLGLVLCWVIWRRGTRDALAGATAAYMVTCFFNAVVLPWYYLAPLALVGAWMRDRRALFAVTWLSMTMCLMFDAGGGNRLYDIVWIAACGAVMWWAARACLLDDGHSLRAAHDFTGEVSVEGVDRAARQ